MNESEARQVVLLQAFETALPASPSWSDDDGEWATRLALHDAAAEADAEGYLARRARHAMQRLEPREGAAASWLARRPWRLRWVVWAVLAGVVLGVLADTIGSSQRINLLAPPLWAVVVWNLVVYALLLGHALAHLLAHNTRSGRLVRLTQRVLRIGRSLPHSSSAGALASGSGGALKTLAKLWLPCSAPLSLARAATLLHAAAAGLALGLIAGLYVRGLVLDYRAAWESTFLGAHAAHAILAVPLAPAVALSGIALPDVVAFEALRVAHGSTAPGAPAAPWIHLIALTLLMLVVRPRSVLALWSALRSRWLALHMTLPLQDAYFQRLLRQQQGDVAWVFVVPYASTPGARAALGLRTLLAPALGDGLQLRIAPTLDFGAEDDAIGSATPPPGTTLAVALFDLSATQEEENQGRFAQQLAARAPAVAATILLVDEAAFRRRFGAESQRLAQRRDAWRVFADAIGTLPVFVDLAGPDLDAAPRALQLALRSPVSRTTP